LVGRSAKLVVQDQMIHEELREKLFALMNEVRLFSIEIILKLRNNWQRSRH